MSNEATRTAVVRFIDEKGRVIQEQEQSLNDIPYELINRPLHEYLLATVLWWAARYPDAVRSWDSLMIEPREQAWVTGESIFTVTDKKEDWSDMVLRRSDAVYWVLAEEETGVVSGEVELK